MTALLQMAGEWLGELRRQGRIAPALLPALEAQFTHIGDAVGGCERLAATPIPFTYGVIIHRTAYLYCLLLPFGLVDSIGSMTPVIVVFVPYTCLALQALGSELEEPLGSQANDCRWMRCAGPSRPRCSNAMGERDWPPEPRPRDYVLT